MPGGAAAHTLLNVDYEYQHEPIGWQHVQNPQGDELQGVPESGLVLVFLQKLETLQKPRYQVESLNLKVNAIDEKIMEKFVSLVKAAKLHQVIP